ncbi:MAG TPA: PilZ domain-containing protein [Kofleriaceae bacterium]|nr:PilZ domain-containing protein [Kofleriaceae bacterium]
MSEPRRAQRLVVNAPAVIESIGQASMQLHPNLARVFRRVDADKSSVGTKFPAMIRDLSTNGAFVSGAPLPLLSRVALKFELKGVGTVDAIGWVLWQRMDDCEVPNADASAILPKGFGVLFEAIPMETRTAIAALVSRIGGQ